MLSCDQQNDVWETTISTKSKNCVTTEDYDSTIAGLSGPSEIFEVRAKKPIKRGICCVKTDRTWVHTYPYPIQLADTDRDIKQHENLYPYLSYSYRNVNKILVTSVFLKNKFRLNTTMNNID